jgi:hypothetical protein
MGATPAPPEGGASPEGGLKHDTKDNYLVICVLGPL